MTQPSCLVVREGGHPRRYPKSRWTAARQSDLQGAAVGLVISQPPHQGAQVRPAYRCQPLAWYAGGGIHGASWEGPVAADTQRLACSRFTC